MTEESIKKKIGGEKQLIKRLRSILEEHQDTQSQRFVEIVENQIAGVRRKIDVLENQLKEVQNPETV